MKNRFLSAVLAGALAVTTLTVPVSAVNEENITVTYSPENYIIRYGGQYSHTKREQISVNNKPANIRTDQDDYYSQYEIAAPEAVEKVSINIPDLLLKKKTVNITDDAGNVTGTEEQDAIMGMSLYYSTSMNDIPADGDYYKYTETDDEGNTATKAVGGTVEEVTALLKQWRTNIFLHEGTKNLISLITPTTFGITDATTSNKYYDVSKDITETVKDALIAAKTENNTAYLDIVYAGSTTYGIWAKTKDYYVNPNTNWAEQATLTVEYSADAIVEDVNSAATAAELKSKVYTYAPLFGVSASELSESVLDSKLPGYVGTTFTFASFKSMIEAMLPVDITSHQSELDYNVAYWGVLGETVTSDTAVGSGFIFQKASYARDSYTFKPFTVTKDADGNVTYPENGDEIVFNVEGLESINVNDHVDLDYGKTKGEYTSTLTVSDVARHAKRVYFLARIQGEHTYEAPISVTYSDGTAENVIVKMTNRGQTGWNTNANYMGDFGEDANRIGNNGYRRTSITTAEDGTKTVAEASSSGGDLLYGFEVDSSKIIEKIEFPNSGDRRIIMNGVFQSVMSNAELQAAVDEVEAYTEVTPENSEAIFAAEAYADELITRNAAVEADFAALNALVEEAEWYAAKTDGEQLMLDISDKFNLDAIAPVGSQVEAAWDGGLNATDATKWKASWTFNGAAASTYANGVRSLNEHVYEENEDGTYSFNQSGKVISFSTPENGFEAGVKDVIRIPGAGEAININASGKLVDKAYFLWTSTGSWADPSVKVNYEDGSSETTKITMCGYGWASDSAKQANKSYPNLAGGGAMGWSHFIAVKNENDEYYTVTQTSNATCGMTAFYVDVDSTKKVKSYDIIPATQYVSYLYAMTEVPMTNAELQAVIDEAKKIEIVMTEKEAELAKTAAAYAKELNERHAVKLEDNADILKLAQQAEEQSVKYMDLSSMVNTDIIVKTGETRHASYVGRDDVLINADKNEISSGTVTITAPGDSEYTSSETGVSFKLSGGYTGNGNDAVAVNEGGDDVTFNIDGDVLKHVSFLIDAVDTSISANDGCTVAAVVNYTDGTYDEADVQLYRTDTWYAGQYAARKGVTYAHYDSDTNAYAEEKVTTDTSSSGAYIIGAGFDIPTFKEVASVTLKAAEKYSYNVLAVTTTPYTNAELSDKYIAFADANIFEESEVNAENAQLVADGCVAMNELYNRGYTVITAADIEWLSGLYSAALKYLVDEGVLSFTPAVVAADNQVTASVNMINTTAADQSYVLIVAAYDSANKLLDFKATAESTLKAGTATDTNSISMSIPAGAVSYKAMVWKSLTGMTPLAVAAK